MNCPSCQKETAPDSFFCYWCDRFIPDPGRGKKAGVFRRFMALMIDPVAAVLAYVIPLAALSAISKDLALVAAILLPFVYLLWFLMLLREGQTPGKRVLGLRVVEQTTGRNPGFGRMFVRELPGRFLSGLIFGLGYLWALFDKNSQAWHDRLARTVVVEGG
jgi:uncharacterized RDD family membrane protein YckC